MKLIAKKPCSFHGKKFYIGDEIPADYVLDAKEQEQMGVLAIADTIEAPAADEKKSVDVVCINVSVEEGELPLEITREGLQEAVNVLTTTVDEAKGIIELMTDNDALLLLHMADNRSTIRKAVEERGKELNTEDEEEGEQ